MLHLGMRYGRWLLIAAVLALALGSVVFGLSHCPPSGNDPCP
jgi:hypothetical protein